MLRSTDEEMVMPLLLMGKAAPLPRLPRFSTGTPSLLRTSSLLNQKWHQVIVTSVGRGKRGGGGGGVLTQAVEYRRLRHEAT